MQAATVERRGQHQTLDEESDIGRAVVHHLAMEEWERLLVGTNCLADLRGDPKSGGP